AQTLGERTSNGQRIELCRNGLNLVGHSCKDDQTFEIMIAIVPTPCDMQRQIQLCRRRLYDSVCHQGYSVAFSSVRPSASLETTRSLTLPSLSTEDATRHWNFASSRRPAFQ